MREEESAHISAWSMNVNTDLVKLIISPTFFLREEKKKTEFLFFARGKSLLTFLIILISN